LILQELSIPIEYNFFESNHGHSVCDRVAAHAKNKLNLHQRNNNEIISTSQKIVKIRLQSKEVSESTKKGITNQSTIDLIAYAKKRVGNRGRSKALITTTKKWQKLYDWNSSKGSRSEQEGSL